MRKIGVALQTEPWNPRCIYGCALNHSTSALGPLPVAAEERLMNMTLNKTLGVVLSVVAVVIFCLLILCGRLMYPSMASFTAVGHSLLPAPLWSRESSTQNTDEQGSLLRPHCHKPTPAPWGDGLITQLLPPIKKNCSGLFKGDTGEIGYVRDALKQWKSATSEVKFLNELASCSHTRHIFLNNFYVSPDEKAFPIAYILIVYTNPRQIIRFLRTIYRPQNLYCIHPDPQSGKNFRNVFNFIAKCLDNVFVASKLSDVYYGHRSILDAQVNCYRDLLDYPRQKWHFVINLCGRELPLKTNREIVEILASMNGSSVIRPVKITDETRRLRFKFERGLKMNTNGPGKPVHTNIELKPVPYDIDLYKSLTYNALSREFVTYLFTNQTSLDFLKWIRDAGKPEEHFYASMYMVPGVPQGLASNNSQDIIKCIWVDSASKSKTCSGKVIHDLCIISSVDLHRVYQSSVVPGQVLFFNKYFMEDDHVVMDCMEERLIEKNKKEYAQDCT